MKKIVRSWVLGIGMLAIVVPELALADAEEMAYKFESQYEDMMERCSEMEEQGKADSEVEGCKKNARSIERLAKKLRRVARQIRQREERAEEREPVVIYAPAYNAPVRQAPAPVQIYRPRGH